MTAQEETPAGGSNLIIPPPSIRAVITKTAEFVSKNGRAFEAKILNSSKGATPKFAFMHATSPYNAWYEWRIKWFTDGGDLETERQEEEAKRLKNEADDVADVEKPSQSVSKKVSQIIKASAIDPVTKSRLKYRSLHSSARPSPIPPSLTPLPIRYASVPPPSTATPLELSCLKLSAQYVALCGRNFLKNLSRKEMNNPIFEFLKPSSDRFSYFTELVRCYSTAVEPGEGDFENVKALMEDFVDVVVKRVEYKNELNERKKRNEESEEVEVDWSDFVVVETVVFESEVKPDDGGMDMEESDDEEGVEVVEDYKVNVDKTEKKEQTMIDPITGKSIAVSEMSEHMRIQLLDPKWASQNARNRAKQVDTNFAVGDSIVKNLDSFAKERLGGTREEEVLRRRIEEREREEEAERILGKNRDTGTSSSAVISAPAPVANKTKPPSTNPTVPQQTRLPPSLPVVAPPPSFPPAPSGRGRGRGRGVSNQPAWMTQGTVGVVSKPASSGAIPVLASRASLMDGTAEQGNKRERDDNVENVEVKKAKVEVPAAAPVAPPATTTTPSETAAAAGGGSATTMLSESDFIKSLPTPQVTLTISCSNEPTLPQHNLTGQTFTVTFDVSQTVKKLKEELGGKIGMKSNKMNLKMGGTFWKDAVSLAKMNVGGGVVEVGAKKRGGK
ncbi:hypothetical protein TrST_g9602 [Triparma strigata]|uniref:Uncharacterized protein n=1 Tax=Triparma strigata TaxID=1606541 RepID=A0A9W6ZPT9_9STRA|nr:hypothetical protein TrST_g9602 [Triparma strigata]